MNKKKLYRMARRRIDAPIQDPLVHVATGVAKENSCARAEPRFTPMIVWPPPEPSGWASWR